MLVKHGDLASGPKSNRARFRPRESESVLPEQRAMVKRIDCRCKIRVMSGAPMDENSENPSTGFWDRNQLYEEVWKEPLIRVAKKYGVSDVAISKACRKLQIPLPGRGYWAKKEHGYVVERVPLPELEDLPSLMRPSRSLNPKVPECAEDRAEFERIDRLLTDGAYALEFDKKMLDHPLVRATREALESGREDTRHILSPVGGPPCLDIRVSKKRVDLALRVAAQLIAIFEVCQYRIAAKSGLRESAVVLPEGDEVRFTIREKVKQLEPSPRPSRPDSAVLIYKQVDYEPTGQLSIEAPEYADLLKKKWSDTEYARLEEVIPQCIAGILKIGVAVRRRRLDLHELDLARQKRQIELAELSQRIKDEKDRLEQLELMVSNWRFARDLREFIAEMEAKDAVGSSDSEQAPEFVQWVRWARDQADRIDPLTPSPASVLDQEQEIRDADDFLNVRPTPIELKTIRQERTRYFWVGWRKAKRNS